AAFQGHRHQLRVPPLPAAREPGGRTVVLRQSVLGFGRLSHGDVAVATGTRVVRGADAAVARDRNEDRGARSAVSRLAGEFSERLTPCSRCRGGAKEKGLAPESASPLVSNPDQPIRASR